MNLRDNLQCVKAYQYQYCQHFLRSIFEVLVKISDCVVPIFLSVVRIFQVYGYDYLFLSLNDQKFLASGHDYHVGR